jgi:hypothetical protein
LKEEFISSINSGVNDAFQDINNKSCVVEWVSASVDLRLNLKTKLGLSFGFQHQQLSHAKLDESMF